MDHIEIIIVINNDDDSQKLQIFVFPASINVNISQRKELSNVHTCTEEQKLD